MNFLKVKNFVIVFCISFFISLNFVNAETLEGSIHVYNTDRNSELAGTINLFQETKYNSGFMQLLYGQGYNLGDYLNSYFSINDNTFFNGSYDYGVSIFSINDNFYNSTNVFLKGTQSTIKYLDDYTSEDVYYIIVFSHDDSSYFQILEDEYFIFLDTEYIFYFDSQGTPIGYFSNDFYEYSSDISGNYYFYDSYYDLTSLYAHTFKLNLKSSYYDKIYPEIFYLHGDNTFDRVSNNSGYSGVSGFFKELISDYQELGTYNLDFVYDDVFYNSKDGFIPLFNRWFDESSFAVPDNYSNIDVSSTSKGYYLTPKSGCSYSDYLLYYSGTSTTSVYALYFNFYSLNSETNLLDIYKKVGLFSSKSYVNYSYQPLIDLGVSTTEFLNYTINVYQYSVKYPYLLYYNSSCYSVDLASSEDIALNFDSGDYLLTSSDVQTNYNNDTVNGSNYVNGSTVPSSGSSNGNVSDSNMISGEVFEVNNILNNIPEYLTSIYSSIEALVGICTIFLVGLPAEIYGILFAVFVIGMIVLLIKVFK